MKTKIIGFILILNFLFFNSYSQTWEWAKSIGNPSGNDGVFDLCLDTEGNIYSTGHINYVVTLGNCTLSATSNGKADVLIAKHDSNGNCIWAKSAGGINDDYGIGITFDKDNSAIYVMGKFSSPSAIFSSDTLTSNWSENVFLCKYNTNGDCLWAKTIISSDNDLFYVRALEMDSLDNIYIGGGGDGKIIIGTLTDSNKTFLMKCKSNGDIIWVKYFDNIGISSYKIDGIGNVIFAGNFFDTLRIDTAQLITYGKNDVFLSKLDSSGNLKWVKHAGGPGQGDYPIDIEISKNQNILFTVNCDSNHIIFNCDSNISPQKYLIKLTNNGECLSAINNNDYSGIEGLFIASGDFWYFVNSIGINYPNINGCAYSASQGHIFTVRDTNLNCLGIAEASGIAYIYDVEIDNNANVYIGGVALKNIIFGIDTIYATPQYWQEGFIAKLSGLITAPPPASAKKHNGLFIFPNPAKQKHTLVIPGDIVLNGVMIRVFDSTGRLAIEEPAVAYQQTLDMWGYSKGIYLVRVNVGTIDYVGNIVIE